MDRRIRKIALAERSMMNQYQASLVVLLVLFIQAFATSKIYSGKTIPIDTTIERWQIIEKGDSLIADTAIAPIVIYYDKSDHSLLFTIHGSTNPDSSLFILKTGDLFSARISANLNWDNKIQRYKYEYEIESLPESKITIDRIRIRLGFSPLEVLSPNGWSLNRGVGFTSWTQWQVKTCIPGSKVIGFGFESAGPPTLKEMELSGESAIIMTHEYDEGADIPNFLSIERVHCLIIAPSPYHEQIEIYNWMNHLITNVGKLSSNGYLSYAQDLEITDILENLYKQLQDSSNTSYDKWNPLVNETLDTLSPYQSQIEPEAWSYITENLKYMQRNKDIVWFGK